ncbi:MAG: 16S rRNA (adenine(1518)-N(6)/adenine(1519)-N(6))-dimethyltransferase RsmA [Candidatus Nanohaloarchaea archaeon]
MIDQRKKLQQLGIQPQQGQNFLNSETIIQALVNAGEIEGKTVLEIGAGTGSITQKLKHQADKVIALETDGKLYDYLDREVSAENVEIRRESFLDYEIPEEVDRCVSNIPFQISSEAIEKLGKNQIQSALLVQEELADKIVAKPGDKLYNEFTVLVNYYFIPVKLQTVSSRNYYPEPEVNTAILKLYPNKQRHGIKDEEKFFKLVKAVFTNKRKKLRNAFVDSRHILGIKKEEAKEIRDEIPESEKRVNRLEIQHLKNTLEFLEEENIL